MPFLNFNFGTTFALLIRQTRVRINKERFGRQHMKKRTVGIVGTGIYIPENVITAKEISEATKGVWSEQAIIDKLGFTHKPIPGPQDGTQEMGVKAALDCLKNTQIDPLEIDVILCMGEEWKEYPLTTSALYVQGSFPFQTASYLFCRFPICVSAAASACFCILASMVVYIFRPLVLMS